MNTRHGSHHLARSARRRLNRRRALAAHDAKRRRQQNLRRPHRPEPGDQP